MQPLTTLVEVLIVESAADLPRALGEAAALRGAGARLQGAVTTLVLPGFEARLAELARSPLESAPVALRASIGLGRRWSLCWFEVATRRDALAELARVLRPSTVDRRLGGEPERNAS